MPRLAPVAPRPHRLLRFGWVARAWVHGIAALLAALAAVTSPEALASTAPGQVALGAAWVGLAAHGGFRWFQAVWRAPLRVRAARALEGAASAALAGAVIGVLVVGQPALGAPIRGALAVALLAAAATHLRAVTLHRVGTDLPDGMDEAHREAIRALGAVGGAARAGVLTGLGGALLAGGVPGAPGLLLAAAALLPWTAYCLARAVYRQVPAPSAPRVAAAEPAAPSVA